MATMRFQEVDCTMKLVGITVNELHILGGCSNNLFYSMENDLMEPKLIILLQN